MYDSSELFWKNLYTEEDMKDKIVWGAKSEEDFNKNTDEEVVRIKKGLGIEEGFIFDFGCGIGRLAKRIATEKLTVAGIDVSQPMINKAKEYCKGTNTMFLHMQNGYTLPSKDEVADGIYSHIVLQHINKYKVYFILKEFYRVLKKEGKCFIQLPNLIKCMHEYGTYAKDHVLHNDIQISAMNFWTKEEVKTILEHIGFNTIEVKEEGQDLYIKFKK